MAQVGRISGPLLEANLLRQGIASNTQTNLTFKNTNSDTALLKIDVVNGRIGIDKENPANELQISNTVSTTDLLSTTANIANFDIYNDTIEATNNIYISAQNEVILSNLQTDQFYLTDNRISTTDTNTNIELSPNGTGTVEIFSDTNVDGNIHATENITLDGNIIFGDTGDDSTALVDTVTFDADINSNIIPNDIDLYRMGGVTRRWSDISTRLVNGQLVGVGAVSVAGIDLTSRAGNILYVSANGDNSNAGDHVQGPLLTIEEALSRADASTDGPVTIKVFPGVYEESLPLVVPNRVSIIGYDIRNVVVKPAAGSEINDVFHLDDSTLISDLTIKDFQYDSINNTGYAFRFTPGAVITNRSPYVQNITVITKGSVTSADDPRGFDEGDAGRGAWIDGAELDSASIEASMLFHSATFITPGVDAITMTNGVRVEWLNSFTYFANRGLYALNGSTGRTSYDGSTTVYGAEVRSIGSANVYGNYGAVADGADTLMYLIQHNFGYIGAGKFSDNDESRAIQSQEVTELNNGQIRFVTTDHTGNFRIGDNFFVDFETGNTTLNINALDVDQFDEILIRSGPNTTVIGPGTIDFSSFRITENNFITTSGDLNIAASTGVINLQDNTNIIGNLDVSGNLSYDGALNIKGDNPSDSIVFNVEFEQDFNPHQHQNFTLGSFTKRWLAAYLNRLESSDVSIYDNIITTTASNADLELRANSSGTINVPSNDVTFSQALTVSGATDLQNTNITGTVTHVGDTTQTGNFTISGEISNGNISIEDNFITTTNTNSDLELRASSTGQILIPNNVQIDNNFNLTNTGTFNNVTVQGTLDVAGVLNLTGDFRSNTLDVGGSLTANSAAQFEEILINGNFITTTSTNAPLELRTAGTGTVNLQDTVNVTNNLTAADTTATNANITLNATTDNANIGNVEVNDNYIETTNVNGNLTLVADRDVVVTGTDTTLAQDLTVQGATDMQALDITGSLQHTGAYNQTGNYTIGGELTVDNVYIEDNFITTTSGNLILEATGDIDIDSNNVEIANDLDVDGVTNLDVTNIDGTLTHVGNRTQTGDYTIGGELTVDNVYIEDNFISTTSGDLNLAATGDINVDTNNVVIANNLTVSGTTSLQGTSVTGNINYIGSYNQTGNLDVAGEISNGNISIEDNFIATTNSNSDLELRASGTGEVLIPNNNLQINNNLTVSTDTNLQGTTITGSLTHVGDTTHTGNITQGGELTVDNVYVEDNFITTTTGDLTLSATGDINVDANDVEIAQDLTVSGSTSLQGTTITGTVTHVGDRTQTGNLDIAGEITNGNILIEDNFITTTNTNSDLELRASGTGEVVIDPSDTVTIDNNLFVGGTLNYQGFLTINGDVALLGNTQDGSLTVTNDFDVTGTLDISSQAQFEDVRIEDNFITTTLSNSNLELRAAGTGEVLVPSSSVQVNNGLFAASISTSDINVNNDLVLDELVITDSNIEINENYITTKTSNSNLEFRAKGNVVVQENIVAEQNLTVNGDTTLLNTTINGTLTHVGNRIQTENYTTTNLIVTQDLDVGASTQFEEILIDGNVITTTTSDTDLELRASGTGQIIFNESVNVSKDLTVNELTTQNISVSGTIAIEDFEASNNLTFYDNVITTTESNSNLELRHAGNGSVFLENIDVNNATLQTIGDSSYDEDINITTNNLVINTNAALQLPKGPVDDTATLGDIRFNTDDNVFEGITQSQAKVTFNGVFSDDRQTSVTADLNSNNIRMTVNGSSDDSSAVEVGITGQALTANALQIGDVFINNNAVITNQSNADLELRANGTGDLDFGDIKFKGNLIKDSGNSVVVKQTGFGTTKFGGSVGVVIPYGTTGERPADLGQPDPQLGDSRWNTTIGILETWNGTEYVSAAGNQAAISRQEFDDLLLEFTLIFG